LQFGLSGGYVSDRKNCQRRSKNQPFGGGIVGQFFQF
jgi:hypothetical protein